jgi:hypothetical protein
VHKCEEKCGESGEKIANAWHCLNYKSKTENLSSFPLDQATSAHNVVFRLHLEHFNA